MASGLSPARGRPATAAQHPSADSNAESKRAYISNETSIPARQDSSATEAVAASGRLKFGDNSRFYVDLRQRVDAFFRAKGLRFNDAPGMYAKTAIIVSFFATCYGLLVFAAQTWWQAVPLAVLLGIATAGVGFNIQHDGGHNAYSDRRWINRLMAMTLDVVGGSSYIWRHKHAVFHHTYVNITGHDADIDLGILGRLTPHQKRYPFHRWQHWYLWLAYGLMAIRWQFYADFRDMARGQIDGIPFPRARGWDLAGFFGGKLVFFVLALGIPLSRHPLWAVAALYAVTAFVLGSLLSVVFQLAHCVEEAQFPMPGAKTGRIDKPWAVHQIETTVDFSRKSRVATWLLGGLNHQIEHHLFPRVCHVHYPAISKIVEATCRDHGITFLEHRSFAAGVASHFRWLKRMGAASGQLS